VKVSVLIGGATLRPRLARLGERVAAAALDAASDALADEAERAREAAGLSGQIVRDGMARRRLIGSRDPASVARELGTLGVPPAPWLAPVAPAARAGLRAAAAARVRDVAAAHAGKPEQVAVARMLPLRIKS
jgi:hypothetical protein